MVYLLFLLLWLEFIINIDTGCWSLCWFFICCGRWNSWHFIANAIAQTIQASSFTVFNTSDSCHFNYCHLSGTRATFGHCIDLLYDWKSINDTCIRFAVHFHSGNVAHEFKNKHYEYLFMCRTIGKYDFSPDRHFGKILLLSENCPWLNILLTDISINFYCYFSGCSIRLVTGIPFRWFSSRCSYPRCLQPRNLREKIARYHWRSKTSLKQTKNEFIWKLLAVNFECRSNFSIRNYIIMSWVYLYIL